MSFKKSSVVMLPANEKAIKHSKQIVMFVGKDNMQVPNRIGSLSQMHNAFTSGDEWQVQHLYIFSNDPIEFGDWFIEFDLKGTRSSYCGKPYLCDVGNEGTFILTKDINFPFPENCRKIIATTDKLLVGKNPFNNKPTYLPSPSQTFIERYIVAYNKNTPIVNILVKYELDEGFSLAKSYVKVNEKDNTITINKTKDNWTKEEVIALIELAGNTSGTFKIPEENGKLTLKNGFYLNPKFIEEHL